MDLTELLEKVAVCFEKHRVPFVLIGGMAVATWIRARPTDDVDIVAMARRKDAPRLKPALIEVGARVTALEMRLLFERRFVLLRIGDARLDVHVAASGHDREAWAHAVELPVGAAKVRVASVENLVLYKLIAWRQIDQRDVRDFIRKIGNLNKAYVESWLARLSEENGVDLPARWKQAITDAATGPIDESR
ncbi:MAG: nucleotidyl transferase AbiEii/AbiGii toxin family protein [Planctomycetes bacterium]|nr:nucleotidyl transferase AbiEii/AbiGii toxin family protein [Planctomycetota bacterium]